MNKKSCLLLTHIHIYENEHFKLDILEYALKWYRKNNPKYHIILSGHGMRPNSSVEELCNSFIWSDTVIDNEVGRGHPIIVQRGIDKAISLGFKYIFKSRADSIFITRNLPTYCSKILSAENKELLVSYGTCSSNKWVGDLVTYCSAELLNKIWISDEWDYSTNGLANLGRGLEKVFPNNANSWIEYLRNNVVYKDPSTLTWIDLLGTHPHNQNRWLDISNISKLDSDNYQNYIWGNNWTNTPSDYITESVFYDK